MRIRPPLHTTRERLELADGDFLDLAWTIQDSTSIILVLHGLEGSIRSPYAAGILHALQLIGWRAVLMHFRGCSGESNRLDRSYHSGDTADLAMVVDLIHQRYPAKSIAVIGYSLGGNVLLKWLGEQGANTPLKTGGSPVRIRPGRQKPARSSVVEHRFSPLLRLVRPFFQ